MSTELVEIQQENVLTVFSTKGGLTPFIEQIRAEVKSFEHDMSTGVSRKKTASLARKVASSKTYLDGLGKDLVAGWKSKAKVVDGERKQMRDELSELTVLARKPFTDWEVEQALIKAEKLKKEEAEKLAAQIESDHEIALILFADEMRIRNAAAQLAEQERIDLEEKQRLQIAETARIKAEEKASEEIKQANLDKIAAEETAAAAKQATKDAEWLTYISEAYTHNDKLTADKNKLIAKQAAEWLAYLNEAYAHNDQLIAVKSARDAELRRQTEEVERMAEERKAREADKNHKHQVKLDAMNDFINAGLDMESAKKAVRALCFKNIRHCVINF